MQSCWKLAVKKSTKNEKMKKTKKSSFKLYLQLMENK
jgi:hypothetical protein